MSIGAQIYYVHDRKAPDTNQTNGDLFRSGTCRAERLKSWTVVAIPLIEVMRPL